MLRWTTALPVAPCRAWTWRRLQPLAGTIQHALALALALALLVIPLAPLAAASDCGSGPGYSKNGLTWTEGTMRMNQIQVVGTHNSYHLESPPEERAVQTSLLPNVANTFYSHAKLDVQAEYQHVRAFELDIFADPDGGHYANPFVRQRDSVPLPAPDLMRKAGIKVLHIADVDVNAVCYTLVECLKSVKTWSRAHPKHVPISIMIEFKVADAQLGIEGTAKPIPWNESSLLDGLDAEIRSVFSPAELITADDLRRDNLTLEQSVLSHGWPDLDSARGRVFFTMDNDPGPIRDVYTAARPSLEGRVLLTNSRPGWADCAFQKINDPSGPETVARIQDQVRAGYWVRTRADEPLATILADDRTARRDAAFRSGAHVLATDFPVWGLSARWGVDYAVRWAAGRAVQCNPVNAPRPCPPAALEPADYVRN